MKQTERFEEPHNMNDDEIVALIRRARKVKPPVSLRLKVAWASRFPHGEFAGADAAHARLSIKVMRTAGVTGMIVLLAFLLFAGFTVAAQDSRPGDALYVFKRWREDIETAMATDPFKKGEKNIVLAERRLSELNYLIDNDKVTADRVKYIGEQYSANRQRVNEAVASIAQRKQVEAARLKTQMGSLETQKDNVLAKLEGSMGASGLSVPAGSIPVSVTDSSGDSSIAGGKQSLVTTTGEDGKFSFSFSGKVPAGLSDLEVAAEADGRKTVAALGRPVNPARDTSGRYQLTVNPLPASIEVGQPVSINISAAASDGSYLSSPVFRVEDTTGSGLVNGRPGMVQVQSSESSSASFTLTKSNTSVSRISVSMISPFAEFGEVLAVGATLAPDTGQNTNGVDAQVSAGRITLDNGHVKVTAVNRPGCILDSFGLASGTSAAGPMTDGIALVKGQGAVTTSGPAISAQSPDSVTYSISHELTLEGTSVTVEYRVTLQAGKKYVLIDRNWNVQNPGTPLPAGLRQLIMPRPADLKLGGFVAPRPATEADFQFDISKPYATFTADGNAAALAFPVIQPESWRIGPDGFGCRFSDAAGISTAVLGYTEGSVDKLISEAGEPAAAMTQAGKNGEGFEFHVEAKPADGGKGSVVVVEVLKQYATSDLYF